MRINVTRSSMPSFEEYCEEIRPLWESRFLTNNGVKAEALSSGLCEYLQSDNCVLFSNGHLALEALLRSLDLHGEVITTPFTFASTTHAIVRCGLKPVFCDIREDDCTMDASKIEALITPDTCAIFPVHVYGNLCDTEAIQAIADRHHLPVIYDAAHAFGVRKNGVSSARFGLASMFSFHATKVFHSVEGGTVATDDAQLAQRLKLERNFGIAGYDSTVLAGGNAKLSEFHAAMGLCNLRHFAGEIQKRKKVYEHYQERLCKLQGLRLPAEQEGVEKNYAYYPIILKAGKPARDAVCAALAEKGIFARKYFYPLTSDFECYRNEPFFGSASTPVTKRIADSVCTLPMYADLAMCDVDEICDIVTEVCHE